MPRPTIAEIADALVAELNAATFSQGFTAVRYYQPEFQLADMATLHVSVVPRGVTISDGDRSRDIWDCRVDVAIQKKVEDVAEIDSLAALTEEIADFCGSTTLTGYPEAYCVEVVTEPLVALEHWNELRQFTSVISLTYRVWR